MRIGGIPLEAIRILIADDNESFRSNLQCILSDRYTVQLCQDGKEALKTVGSFQPDIVVVDLLLRKLDGLSLLHEIALLPHTPAILVTTTFVSKYIEDKLFELGVRSILIKPCDLNAAANIVLEMAQKCTPALPYNISASKLLQKLNIPTHMDGYRQLKVAIPIYAKDPDKPLNKVIYAEVAKICGYDNPKQVERSIRNVIDKAWNLRSEILWSEYFPNGKPSNKAFISRLADELLSIETEPAAQ